MGMDNNIRIDVIEIGVEIVKIGVVYLSVLIVTQTRLASADFLGGQRDAIVNPGAFEAAVANTAGQSENVTFDVRASGMMTGAYNSESFSAFRPPLQYNEEAKLISATNAETKPSVPRMRRFSSSSSVSSPTESPSTYT